MLWSATPRAFSIMKAPPLQPQLQPPLLLPPLLFPPLPPLKVPPLLLPPLPETPLVPLFELLMPPLAPPLEPPLALFTVSTGGPPPLPPELGGVSEGHTTLEVKGVITPWEPPGPSPFPVLRAK